jgi:hypothetical protein
MVRERMSATPAVAEELISHIKRQTQPPCMHRFSRYLDVQITSIGTLTWRGNLPPDPVPTTVWRDFRRQADNALQAWVNASPPDGELARGIHTALGVPTEIKRAIVHDFALVGFWDVSDVAGWEWLVPRAQTLGTNAYAVFQLKDMFIDDRSENTPRKR